MVSAQAWKMEINTEKEEDSITIMGHWEKVTDNRLKLAEYYTGIIINSNIIWSNQSSWALCMIIFPK